MGKHKTQLSLVKDYYERTKVQFKNIEDETDKYSNSLYNNFANNEDTDPALIAEWAMEQGVDMYETLSVMKLNNLLMTISMLYHIWEQQLIKFTIDELQHYGVKLTPKALSYNEVQGIFNLYGVSIDKTDSWKKIKELKALVNTIKHGDGKSAETLRKVRPDFFKLDEIDNDTLDLSGSVLLNEYSLQVKEKDLYEYIEATKHFWNEMPERAYCDDTKVLHYINKGCMKSILVFIDGTICDDRHRLHLYGTSDFNKEENILNDTAVIGSAECLNELHEQFNIIYIGARSQQMKKITLKWIIKAGFPDGEIYLSEKQEDRLEMVKALSKKYNIVAGIGDRWDDNELHLQARCMSIILEEYKGNWNIVRKYLLNSDNAIRK